MRLTRFRLVGFLGGMSVALGCPSDDGGELGGTSSTGDPGTTQAATTQDADSTGALTTSPGDASTDTGETGSDDSTGSESGTSGQGSGSTQGDESGTTGVADCTVILAEVVFDPEGVDDQFQWVKLKNMCPEEVDLQTWTLGWGGAHYGDVRNKQLIPLKEMPDVTTVVPGFGCYVVGGPTSGLTNGDPIFDYPDDFAPGFTFAEPAGAGIALFDAPDDDVDETTVPVDAVVYGANNDNGLIDHTGDPVARPHVGLPPMGGSIARTSAEGAWTVNAAPQPGDCPEF